MKYPPQKRKFMADNFAKLGQYIFSLIVIGQIIAKQSNYYMFLGGLAFFIFFMLLAIIIYPQE